MTTGRHRQAWGSRRPPAFAALVVALVVLAGAAAAWRLGVFEGDEVAEPGRPRGDATEPTPESPEPTPAASPVATPPPGPEPINTGIEGLTTFRGNATRTYYGQGPVPRDPEILWRYPVSGGLCGESAEGGETRTWCGTGWTGQPNVVEVRKRTEVRFGAYDYAVHVVDAETGEDVKEPFRTGDIIKGTVTSDPDGFPLIYSGSRDDNLRILATDRGDALAELWSLNANTAPNPIWNNDWDGSPLVIDDYLLEGSENSWFYVVKLNRDYNSAGKVTVDPEVVMLVPGYDDELFSSIGDTMVSIESSVAFHDGVVYFANSGGLVQGWDVSRVLKGKQKHERVFRFWTGDDTDATVVIDDEGFLYVASELERFNSRSDEVGQLMKLDPSKPGDPLVWSIPVPGEGAEGGLWATPALYRNALIVPTNTGRLLGVNRFTGKLRWEVGLPPPTWSSPAIVDGVAILGDCAGFLHAFDVRDPLKGPPEELWSLELGGCIESTPAVWKGRVYVGTRAGGVFAIGDR